LGNKGRLGLGYLPGRKDRSRDLNLDLKAISMERVNVLFMFCSAEELIWAGVNNFSSKAKEIYKENNQNIEIITFPFARYTSPRLQYLDMIIKEILDRLNNNMRVLLLSFGGLGRNALIAACLMKQVRLGITLEQILQIFNAFDTHEKFPETIDQQQFLHHYFKSN